jgi:hypothetical protein
MKHEVQKPATNPSGPPAGNATQPDIAGTEDDPKTWYGLIWRIVHVAIESDEKLVRVCVLIVLIVVLIALVGAAWLVVGVARLLI